jgi:hypothetical protein
MSIYRQLVILWPFVIDSTNKTIAFEDNGGTPHTEDLAEGIYLSANLSIPTLAIMREFSQEMGDAATALGLAGAFGASRDPDGKCRLERTGGVSPGDNLTIDWDASTFPREYLGFDGVSTTIVSLLDQVSPFLVDHQWMPGKPEVHLDPDIRRLIATEDVAISGRPSRVVQSPNSFIKREVIWERLWSARVLQSRADDATYATPADLPTGDDATWENLWANYLMANEAGNPYNDNRIWLLTTNIAPGSDDLEGPYEVILSESTPDMRGVEPSSFVQGLAAEQYDVSMMLWWTSV